MKTVFFQDIRLKCDENNNYYANGSLSNSVLDRYIKYNDEFILFTRKENVKKENCKGYDLLNLKQLSFESLNKLTLSMFVGKDRKKIKKTIEEADKVIVRMPSFIGIPAIMEAKRQKKSCLIEMVGCPFDALWYHGKLIFKLFAFPTMLINKMLIHNNEFVTYVSKEFLQRRYPCKRNQYSIADVDIRKNKNNLNERMKKIENFNKKDVIVMGTISSSLNVKYKGQQYVIKAISLLRKKGYKFEYRIVGSGNRKYLENVARKCGVLDQVNFVGSFPHNEIENFIKGLDFYIQPSTTDALPRVISEAMNTACPVIGSSAGGIPENVNEKFIFKKKNYKDLAKKIELMINSDLKKVCKENYEIAQKYTKDVLDKERNIMFKDFYSID